MLADPGGDGAGKEGAPLAGGARGSRTWPEDSGGARAHSPLDNLAPAGFAWRDIPAAGEAGGNLQEAPMYRVRSGFFLCALLSACSSSGGGGGGGAWSAPTLFPPPETDFVSTSVKVAIDGAGNGLAVMREAYLASSESYFSRYTPASGWSAAEPIGFVIDSATMALAMDAAGNGWLVWESGTTEGTASFDPATGFGPSSTQTLAAARDGVRLAVSPSGEQAKCWVEADPGYPLVHSAKCSLPGTFTIDDLDDDLGDVRGDSLEVAIDDGGNVWVVWTQEDAGLANVYGAHRPAGGAWTAPAPLDTSPYHSAQPHVAAAAGHAVAVWSQPDARAGASGTDDHVYARRAEAGAAWSSPEMLMASADASGYSTAWPRAAVNASGAIRVVWRQIDRTSLGLELWSNRHAGAWAGAARVDQRGGNDPPQLLFSSLAASGAALLVWDDGEQVLASAAPAGQGFGAGVSLNGPASRGWGPDAAANAAGQAVAGWSEVYEATFARTRIGVGLTAFR